jgi:hypothetical protein
MSKRERRTWRPLVMVFATICLLTAVTALPGCSGFGADEEREEQRFASQLSHENAMHRRRARIRAEVIERTLRLPLHTALRPFRGCKFEYRPVPTPRHGVLPLSCGDFGPKWPLRVDHGYLRCEHWSRVFDRGRVIVFTAPKGVEYAVNDAAHAVGYAKLVPLLRIPTRPRSSRQPLVDRGLRLCR